MKNKIKDINNNNTIEIYRDYDHFENGKLKVCSVLLTKRDYQPGNTGDMVRCLSEIMNDLRALSIHTSICTNIFKYEIILRRSNDTIIDMFPPNNFEYLFDLYKEMCKI